MSQTTTLDFNLPEAPRAISLLEFNRRIKGLLYDQQVMGVWVTAETSDVQVRRGHCYLELLQKDEKTGQTVAKIGAVIWASTFMRVGAKFYSVTQQQLGNGMKVMVLISANFHEQYGLKVMINDISPEFTLGDMARRRQEIIDRLTREGHIDENKELAFPQVPQRVAVISSAGAAGYGDFMNQLAGNPYGIKYYPCLFAAMMQGSKTVPSVIDALERIEKHQELFDCVVIIRGGGSTTDLNWFDDYNLALKVAQCPLPVITGIGHERDTTVLDYVAAKPVKTPTAAAEFLIQCGINALSRLNEMSNTIVSAVKDAIARSNEQLSYLASSVPMLARHILEKSALGLQRYIEAIPLQVTGRITAERGRLERDVDAIKSAIAQAMLKEQMRMKNLDDKVTLLSPRNTLKRGYSLTMCNGHIITDASQLHAGDSITTHFGNGKTTSIVNQ